jgi:glyoxylase-like metal-dependent hydrolase (beta-lactamase superfamily II)
MTEPVIAVTGTAQREAWQQGVMPPVEEVRPGLWSIPVPIPASPLRYTLCYLFVGDGGTVIVDPGWDTMDGRQAIGTGLAVADVGVADITGVIVTHVHPDHHGLSGWIRKQAGAWIAMHPAEAQTLPARLLADRSAQTDALWLRTMGVPAEALDQLIVDPAQLAGLLTMAEPDHLINDGDRLTLADREIRAVWTPGHTPGHLCLHDAAAGVLLTGDHLLPRISPNIGVHSARDGDPLTGYLDSLRRTARFDAAEALPAHEYRFRGIGHRTAALAGHHRDRGIEILAAADDLLHPTAWAIASQLSWSRGWEALQGMTRRLALAETVAHLRYLVTASAVTCGTSRPLEWRPSFSLGR